MKRTLLALALLALSASASASLTCNNDDFGQHATWFVGQDAGVLDVVSTDGAVWCVATGSELAYIQQHFTGLRGYSARGSPGIVWSSDDASFILDNL
jgi:hypothetical protein